MSTLRSATENTRTYEVCNAHLESLPLQRLARERAHDAHVLQRLQRHARHALQRLALALLDLPRALPARKINKLTAHAGLMQNCDFDKAASCRRRTPTRRTQGCWVYNLGVQFSRMRSQCQKVAELCQVRLWQHHGVVL